MKTKRYRTGVLLGLTGAVVLAGQSQAQEVLPEIRVAAEKLITPTMQSSETVYTGSEITTKGMEIQGIKATTSVYNTLDMLPGISVENSDSSGLAAEMSSVRVRGVRSSMGAMTVQGVPNYGGNPMGPRDYVYDIENMQSVSIYKGAIPGDIGTGVGSRGGAIELQPDWPREDFGLFFKQTLGSNKYTRSYLRLDSGDLTESGTRVSGSVSYSESDKWRGPGTLGPRKNANVTLSQALGERVDLKLWYNHNNLDQHLYNSLSYNEIKNNYSKDYNATLTGNLAQDINYYDYNRGSYQNDDFFAMLTLQANKDLKITLKPYHTREDVEILQGNTSGPVDNRNYQVVKRLRDIKHTGIIAEAMMEQGEFKGTLGYHFEESDSSILTQNYAMTPRGLAYRGFSRISVSDDNTYIHSPYAKVAGSHGAFDWQAGLKYFSFEEPASAGYVSGPGPQYALRRAPDIDKESNSLDIVLPTVAAAYRFDKGLESRISYGKTFIRPYSYMPLHNLYNQNRALFQEKRITLQQLFDGYGFEESDVVDVGFRYTADCFEIAPTFFYSKHKNLLTSIYDPRVELNYNQNVGKATSYGLDLEMNAYINQAFTLFVNPTYNSMTYDEDLVFAGRSRATEDKQVVDVPEWMAKAGFIWNYRNFEAVPMLRYIGTRYADAENLTEVDSYFLADLRMSYTLPELYWTKEVKLSLELNNLFDKEYITRINASDTTRAGQASYHPGSPFNAMLTLSVRY